MYWKHNIYERINEDKAVKENEIMYRPELWPQEFVWR